MATKYYIQYSDGKIGNCWNGKIHTLQLASKMVEKYVRGKTNRYPVALFTVKKKEAQYGAN